ncbi:MAG: ArnT family glycosyltransferase [Chloroflexota bacterium]
MTANRSPRSRTWFGVFALAVAVRTVFALITHDTYDYDEFVILLLARDFAHGAVPYHDFMFFHPPGILVLYRAIEPLTNIWWPLARALTIGVDGATTVLVWRLGKTLYGDHVALFAGLVYAFSPLALIASVRVGQDPVLTLLGMLGLWLLVELPSQRTAVIAGICLALAVWTKFPALVFLPVYLLAAPQLFPYVSLSLVSALVALFAPFAPVHHDLYYQTVTFQRTRWSMTWGLRLETLALFWLLANPLALVGLLRTPRSRWLVVGFALGALFVLSSQVYYHYFVPIGPFAALLSAPVVERVVRGSKRVVCMAGVLLTLCWGGLIDLGGPSPMKVTAAHISDIEPVVTLIDRKTTHAEPILADRFEYPYLARREPLAHYFWNVGVLVNDRYLERLVHRSSLVVLSYGASSGYPPGFLTYLDRRYPRLNTRANTVWLIRSKSGSVGG